MELTKVNVTEGIKLSEVTGNESIYEWCNGSLIYRHSKDRCDFMPNCYYCIIRDNKVIPIIKDEEYDNEKPYLIGKDENHIIGFINYDEGEFYHTINIPRLGSEFAGWVLLDKMIKYLNQQRYYVYKQE